MAGQCHVGEEDKGDTSLEEDRLDQKQNCVSRRGLGLQL